MRILLANPRGLCAGVKRAIGIVNCALEIYGTPIYVKHEIVHNQYIVNKLRKLGVLFIESINEVPDNSILIFSAHGVSNAIQTEARKRNLKVLDATCPLVTKVHMEVKRASYYGTETILIGNAGHPEIEGTIGQYSNIDGGIYLIESIEDVWRIEVKNANNLCFVTQTTLSIYDTTNIIDALRARFPTILNPHKNNICYATTNRQKAVNALSNYSDIVLVIGSQNSSNSNRLVELVQQTGKPAYLVDNAEDIQPNWLYNIKTIGVTAGASAPNILVNQVIKRLTSLGAKDTQELLGIEENVIFRMPKELNRDIKSI